GVNPPSFASVQLTPFLTALDMVPGAVSEIVFGKYVSPDYEVHPGEYIPAVGTRTGTPAVQSYNDIYFNLFLPSGHDAGWRLAGGDLRPWILVRQKRQFHCRREAGGARDRDHRHQRRRSRLRPTWYADGEPDRRKPGNPLGGWTRSGPRRRQHDRRW